jgi:ABC-type multidrug transport system fused ATPase/permease subunit
MTATQSSPSPSSAASVDQPSLPVDQWRGVAAEDADQVSARLTSFLRNRSRRLAADLLRPHRRALVILALVIVLNNLALLAGPYLVKYGIDSGIPPLLKGGSGRLWPLLVAVSGIMVAAGLQAVTFNSFQVRTGQIGQDLLFDLRTRLFDHAQRLSVAFHERYTSGRVISRLTSDMDAISDLFEEGLQALIIASLSAVTCGTAMLLLDPVLGLIAVLSFPFVLLLTRWFRGGAERAYRATREAIALVIVHFTESLGGIRAVQAFRRQPRNQAIFDNLDDRYREANAWTMRLGAVYAPGLKLLGHVTTAVVLLVGANRVLHHQTQVGVLAAMFLYLRRFYDPMQDLAQFYNVLQAAAAAVEKVAGVLDEAPGVPEPQHPVTPDGHGGGEVRFAGVRFAYRAGLPAVLGADEPLDLLIPAGQTVALVGETGAGKTTIARLIARFYDPVEGVVELDGIDLRRIADRNLRRAVVTVTQESFLFSGTVGQNISFGRPGASPAEIAAAAEAIGAAEFIEALPQRYETDVRKRGGRLSAGQRQLVSFARAFLANPRVLILDEATSSLDLPSERLVQRALQTLLAERTAVIIAHRLSTVEIADRVLVVTDGRIVEEGAPAELIRRGGHYGDLHQAWLDSLA